MEAKRLCAIYPRYSSDLQRESSIEDQVRKCRERAAREDWSIAERYTVGDEAVSGESIEGRPALKALLAAAKLRPRPFDCVLVEDTSRLSRNLADQLRMIEIFKFNGVDVVSVMQGIDTAQENARTLLTAHGMVDEQFLVGLRQKVHRGQEGRVLQGFNPGGRCYGYRNIPIEDPTRQGKYGRPAVQGVRQEIIPEEAVIVRRIFQMYASGAGLAAIAKLLNQEGVLAPKPAKNRNTQAWSRYTIREMLHNEKYRGIVIWNRTKKTRNPETGRKVSKARPQAEWRRKEVDHLKIVSEEIWLAAHRRNAEVNQAGIARQGGLSRTQQSRSYLFSGLLACGMCGSNMVIVSGGGKRGYVKYGCHQHKQSGICGNTLTIRRERLEEQLLGEIERRVFQSEAMEYVLKRCQEELQRRIKEMERERANSNVDELRRQKDGLREQAARLAEAIGMGGDLPSLLQRLRSVESAIKKLEIAIEAYRPISMKVTTEQIREHVMASLMELRTTLNQSEVHVARNARRRHLGRLVLTPTMKESRQLFRVSGNVSLIPEGQESGMLLVARDGTEPPTPAFSRPRSTNARGTITRDHREPPKRSSHPYVGSQTRRSVGQTRVRLSVTSLLQRLLSSFAPALRILPASGC